VNLKEFIFLQGRNGLKSLILTLREQGCYGTARAEVAQLAEHSPEKAGVDSSILSLGTINQKLTSKRPPLSPSMVPL
jgi:hypothetical protein